MTRLKRGVLNKAEREILIICSQFQALEGAALQKDAVEYLATMERQETLLRLCSPFGTCKHKNQGCGREETVGMIQKSATTTGTKTQAEDSISLPRDSKPRSATRLDTHLDLQRSRR